MLYTNIHYNAKPPPIQTIPKVRHRQTRYSTSKIRNSMNPPHVHVERGHGKCPKTHAFPMSTSNVDTGKDYFIGIWRVSDAFSNTEMLVFCLGLIRRILQAKEPRQLCALKQTTDLFYCRFWLQL